MADHDYLNKDMLMQIQTHNNTHFKGASKNLANEIKKLGINISHSSALNIMARAIGYENYNTYKAINEDISKDKYSIDDYLYEYEKEREEKHPSIDDLFVLYTNAKSDKYDMFIHKEISSNGIVFYLLFRLKSNSITDRVFYSPRYETFSLFVYPNIKDAVNDYDFSIEGIEKDKLDKEYFRWIKHLNNSKDWFNSELLEDTINLMEAIKEDRNILSPAGDIDQKELEELYTKIKPIDY